MIHPPRRLAHERQAPPLLDGAFASPLTQRLANLRRAFRWRVVLAKSWRAAMIMLGLFVADFLLDYLLSLARPLRILLGLLLSVSVAVVWYRALRAIIAETPSVSRLAHRVERHFPALRGLLVNAVEWDGQQVPAGTSQELVAATQRRAESAAAGLSFREILDRDWTRRQWLAAGIVGFLGCALAIAAYASPTARIWGKRNLAWEEIDYPRRTRIEFEGLRDREIVVARGGEFRVRMRVARNETPPLSSVAASELAVLESDPPRLEFEPRRSHALTPLARGPESRYELHVRDILEPFQFRVAADDARTAWIPVRTVDPPSLADLRLQVVEPTYTGGATVTLTAGQGPYRVLRGSRLRIAGRMKQPIVQAWALTGKTRAALSVDSTDPRQFHGELSPHEWSDGWVSLSVADRLGLDFARAPAFRVELLDDTPPRVAARWTGASRLVAGSARLSASVEVEDDRAVSAVRLLARITDSQGDEVRPWTPVDVALKESSAGPTIRASIAAPQARLAATTSPTTAPGIRRAFSADVSLATLDVPAGAVLTLVWEATDNDTVSGPKQGRSTERPWSVVEPGELRDDWLRREKEQRQQLEQLRLDCEEWRKLLDESRADDRAQRVREFGRLRESLSDRAEELDLVRTEIAHSGLETMNSPLLERFAQRIMAPLVRARDQESVRVERLARDAFDAGAEGTANPLELAQAQDALDRSLREVIRELSRAEGFQEAVRLIEDLRSGQRELLFETLEAQRRRVRQLLDGEAKRE